MDYTAPRLLSFQSVDLDTWAEESLKVIEVFFRPQFAHAVALIDRLKFMDEQAFLKAQHITADSFTTAMLNARESLANTLSQMVVPVLQSPTVTPAMLQKAKDSYREQILSKLDNAYSIDTLVQASVSLTEANTALPSIPVTAIGGDFISGTNISQQDKTAANLYDLSFFVSVPDKEAHSSIRVSIGQDQPGQIAVPIALRNYPPVPLLESQNGSQAGKAPVTNLEKLTSALNWDYSYTYSVDQGAQDQIYSSIEFNTHRPASSVTAGQTDTGSLFDSLAQFSLIQEALAKDLVDSLEQIGPKTTAQDPNIDKAYVAIATLVQLSNNLAIAWARYTPAPAKMEMEEPVQNAYDFMIVQAPDPDFVTKDSAANGGTPRLLVSITPPGKLSAFDKRTYPVTESSSVVPPDLPLISLDGYEQENATDTQGKPIAGTYWYYTMKGTQKEYLAFEGGEKLIDHKVILSGFNILKTQSACASTAIIRNEHLVKSSDTTPELIYHSPVISFAASLIPSFTSDIEIDISRLNNDSGSETDLVNHLSDFFSLVFANSPDEVAQIRLKVSWVYSAPQGGTQLTMPVLASTEFSIKIPKDYQKPASGCSSVEASFVCKIADAMKAWYTNNQPSVNQAFFQLDFAVFSKEEPASVLLEFTNLVIPYAIITDL
ncbi:MAG: hypothetical protein Roseis2KO_30010 [Roseivirga sp.]